MRAVAITAESAPLTLIELDRPKPGAGEVLVRVKASSLNGFDVAVANGYLTGMMEHKYPVVLGKDFAGIVEDLGGGVTRFRLGDEVFGVVTESVLSSGSFAEYIVVNESASIYAIPDGATMSDAGAIGLAGAAAIDSIDAAKIEPLDVVLIVGATGGVGTLILQYAVDAKANIIATATPGIAAEFVTDLGAAATVNPEEDLAEQVIRLAPGGVDVIFHLAGDPARLPLVLSERGRIISTLGYGVDKHPLATAIMANPSQATLARLAADMASERIGVPITDTFELDQLPEAIAAFPKGTLGKHAINIA